MDDTTDNEALAAAAAAAEMAEVSGSSDGLEAGPQSRRGSHVLGPLFTAVAAAASARKMKAPLKLSGRLGATREAAQRQVQGMLDITGRVETAAQAAVVAAADPELTLEEAREHLAGLTALRDELQAVELTAIAAADAQPLLITVEARTATVDTLIGLFAVREARLGSVRTSTPVTGNHSVLHVRTPPSTGKTPLRPATPPVLTPVAAMPAAPASAAGGRQAGPPSPGGPPAASTLPSAARAPPPPLVLGNAAFLPPAAPHPHAATVTLASAAPYVAPSTAVSAAGPHNPAPRTCALTAAPTSTATVAASLGPVTATSSAGHSARPPAGAAPLAHAVAAPTSVATTRFVPISAPLPPPQLLPPAAVAGGAAHPLGQPWGAATAPPPLPAATTHFPFPPGLAPGPVAAPTVTTPSTAPPWSTTSNPYVTNDALLGPDYYAAFPYPWNVMPTPTAASHGEMLKVAANALPKFDGKRANYLAWRGTFLPCVHLTTIPMNLKVMLLRSTLKTDTEDMRELATSIVFTAEGYRQAICMLEKDYGGDETLLLVRQESLLELPVLKEGDYQNLKTLFKRLGNFLNQWATLNGGALTAAESITFFRQLFNRIERRYAHKYISWAQEGARERGLQSLYLWLGTQYENHRIVAQYTTHDNRAAATEGQGNRGKQPQQVGSNQWGGNRRPSPYMPASHLDRNYKQHAFQNSTGEEAPQNRDQTRRQPCPKCTGNHTLGRCFKFRDSTPDEKKTFLIEQKRCFLCLATGHSRQNCRADYRCRVCNGRHNTALHEALSRQTTLVSHTQPDERPSPEEPTDAEYINDQHAMVAGVAHTGDKMRVSLRTVPVWIGNPINGRGKLVNALLDDGCTGGALVSNDLAAGLLLKGRVGVGHTEGVGGKVTEFKTISAPSPFLRLTDHGGENYRHKSCRTQQVRTDPLTGRPSSTAFRTSRSYPYPGRDREEGWMCCWAICALSCIRPHGRSWLDRRNRRRD